jgi:pimeloyl-ACP methyl ester carboxylesterase
VLYGRRVATVECGGVKFHVEERGAGPALVLIHGTGGHTGAMAGIAERLATEYRTITYDRRGHSQTAGPIGKTKGYLARHVDDAAALLRELGVQHAIVFGWSWGAIVALGLAISHPDLVQRLVLFEAPLHAKKHMTFQIASGIGGAILLGKLGMHRRGALRFARFALTRVDGTNAFTELDEPTRESLLANAKTIVAELAAGTGEELTTESIAAIHSPISLIVGNRSRQFLKDASQRIHTLMPSAREATITGDHLTLITHPDELVRAIRDCLA